MSMTNDSPARPETMRALREVMYDPRRCCNADTPLYVANLALRRAPKVTHATVADLSEREAQIVLDILRELFPDQRGRIRARAVQMMPGTR